MLLYKFVFCFSFIISLFLVRDLKPHDPQSKADPLIVLNVEPGVMRYDKDEITAKAGTTIRIELNNTDFMPHNIVIIKPGTAEKVGAAADHLAQQTEGEKLEYVPRIPEVLAFTPQINPNEMYILTFKVPSKPSDYPYLCTFPGHWRIMNGVLKVIK